MELAGTGAQLWPLTTGNNQAPTLSQGVPTSFFCNTVPDRCPSGPLAYYLPVVLLTIYGTLTQPSSGGTAVYWDQLIGALIDSIDWINAWHGTVVSANHVKGVHLPVVEYYANGFRYGDRRRPPIPSTAGTYTFGYTVAITPSISRLGRLMPDTMQLAKLFLQSQLKINVAPASALTALSTGATFGTLTAKASAVLVPRQELVLGTPVETILHQIVAGSTSSAVQIKGFGTDTMLKGINNKGGVVFLGELTSAGSLGGAFTMESVTQYSFPWRGQEQTQHPEGIVCMSQFGNMPNDRANTFPSFVAGGDGEYNNPPFIMSKSDAATTPNQLAMDLVGNMFWPMVQGGNDLTLAELQTASNDAQYFLTVSGGFTGNTHLVLAMYARQWLDTMMADWVKQVTDGGTDSLASYVLGGQAAVRAAKLQQRRPRIKHVVTPDQATYLPWQFI
jgi:hypothetical protein